LPDDELGHVLFAGDAEQAARYVAVRRADHLRAQFPGQRQVPGQPGLLIMAERFGQLDVHREPGRLEFPGQAFCPAHQGRGGRTGAYRHQQPLAGFPRVRHALCLPVGEHVLSHLFGREPQRQLAQRGQVAGSEELLRRRACGFRQ
jgi:hypothetical protein